MVGIEDGLKSINQSLPEYRVVEIILCFFTTVDAVETGDIGMT